MANIFISHSSKDRELVTCIVDFMQKGMGIARNQIFCTSFPNSLPTGEDFIQKIREELSDCAAVVFVITEHYLKSMFCFTEMGAAWGLAKKIYPLLLTDLEKIRKTPLLGHQVLFLKNQTDISTLYDGFCFDGIITSQCTAEYMSALPEFMKKLNILIQGEFLLQMDEEGFYRTEIVDVRKVPSEFRCYKIKGHVKNWTGKDDARSDWIFFRTGMFEDLETGDEIRFKISKTDEKNWRDIGIARNIYPSYLEKK